MENLHAMYLRDSKTKHPVGIVLTRKGSDGIVEYQYSVWNPVQNYDRDLGYKVALGRFETAAYAVRLPEGVKVTGHVINTSVLKDMLNHRGDEDRLPTRAKNAIVSWLKKHGQI